MAVELASAFVSIIPTTKGLTSNLERELSPLTGVAAKAGDTSGKALGSSFTGASGGLKTSLGEAEGLFGNFKSKATGALSSVGVSSGLLAAAGGAALVGFAVSAVGAFTDTAKAAIDMSAATGLTIEDASRWIALGDDFEISAGTMTTSLGKIAKTLDTGKWKQYGIETRDAGGQARSTNDILLDTFDLLGKTGNETERARIGNDLFGKGYTNLAPLIGKTRAEMEKYLGSVEKGQVITEKEAGKAEKMRLAEDALKDAFGEVTLAVGALVASLAPLISVLSKVVTIAADGVDAVTNWTMNTNIASNASDYFSDVLGDQNKAMGDSTTSALGYSYAVQDVQRATDEAIVSVRSSTNAVDGYSYAAKSANETTARLAVETAEATRKADFFADSLRKARERVEELYGAERSGIDAKYAFAESTRQADEDVAAYVETLKNHKAGTEETDTATRTASESILQASEDYATLNGASINSALGTQRQIDALTLQAAQLAPGSPLRTFLEGYIADLNRIQTDIQTRLTLNISMGQVSTAAGDVIGQRFGARASGGWASGRILAGERGPEFIDLPSGSSYVHTAAQTAQMMSASSWATVANTSTPPIVVHNYREDIGVATLNHVLAMARLAS